MEKVRPKQKKKKVRTKSEDATLDVAEEAETLNPDELISCIEPSVLEEQVAPVDSVTEERTVESDNVEVPPVMAPLAPLAPLAPAVPTYRDLSGLIQQMEKLESVVEHKKVTKVVESLRSFAFEELETLFGTAEMNDSRRIASQFEERHMHSPPPTHPLYEALLQYQKARSLVLNNLSEINSIASQCNSKEVWTTKTLQAKAGADCSDGRYISKSYKYTKAILRKDVVSELQRSLKTLRNKATEIHSLHSHSEYLYKIQVDDLLWTSVTTGSELMKDAIDVLFFVVRSSGWGFDKHLRQQLRNWCCLLVESFLKAENNLEGVLFVLHHLLRVPQGIKWAIHLIQCQVNEMNDIQRAFCLFETILILCNKKIFEGGKKNDGRFDSESDGDTVVVGSEATDESLWLVVDSEGEGADIEPFGANKQVVLKETDVINLIKQIPFENVFKELMFVRENNDELIFCGGNLSGATVLKIFAAVRIFLRILRDSLLCYQKYIELSKELCRLALHSVMYCTDLWEVASSQCEANLYERLSLEYNNIVQAALSTLEYCGSREISAMFVSEMPFTLCKDEIVYGFYEKISKELIVSDSIWCYYTLVTIQNMANARRDESFKISAVRRLFEIGFTSDFAELGCGEWARTLCGGILSNSTDLIGPILKSVPEKTPENWLNSIPLSCWRPDSEELLHYLNHWKNEKFRLLPHLIRSLDWTSENGICPETQRNVAAFLANIAENFTHLKLQFPEWVWECLLILRLHNYDWKLPPSRAPSPESLGLDLNGRFLVSNLALILSTSWGHSIPLIIQNGLPMLLKLANGGRFTEVIHAIHYIVPCLAESPEAVKQNKVFKELLTLIFKEEKTWQKVTARLVAKDFSGPNIKALMECMQLQLGNFQCYSLASPCSIMSVWIHWITSLDNWQSDWLAIYLLDYVLGCCFFHHDAMAEASRIFQSFIQIPTSPKSPNSSSFSNWLWNGSSSGKCLIQCTMEAPFVWHLALWMEHITVERNTGLWQKLLEKLSQHKEGKINIDKTLKSIGGSDNSSVLAIYRSIQCAMNTPMSHPIYTLMWQLFFYLYMDLSFSTPTMPNRKPVGALFFDGVINSKTLSKAKSKLIAAKFYFESVAEIAGAAKHMQENHIQYEYYMRQAELMNTFQLWLSENFFDYPDRIFSHPHSDKLNMLLSGKNVSWTDTINMQEFKRYQPSKTDISRCSPKNKLNTSNQSTKNKQMNSTPDDRVIQRLKTYEKPRKTSVVQFADPRLVPIFEPRIIRDFVKVLTVMKSNLKELLLHSKNYCNMIKHFDLIDENLMKLYPKLYQTREIHVSVTESCGNACTGSARFVIKGQEDIFDDNINSAISSNRENHQVVLNKAIEPYKTVSTHTALISKLSQMICSESISVDVDDGAKIFYLVLEALKNENLLFPPVNDVLNTLAVQLGEKFVRVSGAHCSNLISRMKNLGNEALISSLLRPLDLTTGEMLTMYNVVNATVADPHVAFSCLSKFRISTWLRDVRPSVSERATLINHICDGLSSSGCSPPMEQSILHELMCVHLGHVLAWEFPVHLDQVFTCFHSLSLDKKLPPEFWEHCFGVIEKYPHLVSQQQAIVSMDIIGRNWWMKRGAWGLHGLYDQYSLYVQPMTRLGALLTSTILNTAMVQQPLILTNQITYLVFNSMCAFWNVWLVPRWETPEAAWNSDYTRSPPLMPWGPDDNTAPLMMLKAFVETLMYCIEILPGSAGDFLRLTWQWYFTNYPNPAVSFHVLTVVHRILSTLPWCVDTSHWITFTELQMISKVCSVPIPSCHNFILNCLGNRPWQGWMYELPVEIQPNALYTLLPIIVKLRCEQQVLQDVLQLPWGLMRIKNYEEILSWFMSSVSTQSEPFYFNEYFPLICTVGGLKANCEISTEWESKQICLVKEWVNALSTFVDSRGDLNQKRNINRDIADSITNLLNKIEKTSLTLVNGNDAHKIASCTLLLNSAIMMLNMTNLQDIASTKWIEWITTTPKLCIDAMVSCVFSITHNAIFSNLAEHTLNIYFNHNGDWKYVLNLWKHNCFVPVHDLIDSNSFLTSFMTYKSLDFEKYEGKTYEHVDKFIINSLGNIVPCSAHENQITLWILYMVSLVMNLYIDKQTKEKAINQITSILEKWSEEPGLWKTYVQNTAPSARFRMMTKYAYCTIVITQARLNGETSNPPPGDVCRKFFTSLEGAAEQKQHSHIRNFILEHLGHLQEKTKNCQHATKRAVEFCSKLHSDVHYLSKVSEVFDSFDGK